MENEKRLIDANALDSVLEDFANSYRKDLFLLTAQAISDVRKIVYAMKDVDAVEVVRCKDCEHCRTTYTSKEHTPFHFCKKMNSTAVKLEGFCFYGERKDNE